MGNDRIFDVQRFIDEQPIGRFHWLILILTISVMVLDGLDTLVVAFIAPAVMKNWHIGSQAFAPVMLWSLVGATVGSYLAGPLSDRYGRKIITVISVLVMGIFCLACARATDVTSLAVLRFFTGIGLGATIPSALVTLAEYAPLRYRSLMVTTAVCGVSIGAGLAGIIYAHLEPRFGWQSMLIAGGVLPLVLVPFLLLFLPESVRFLLLLDAKRKQILRIMRRMSSDFGFDDIVFEQPKREKRPRNPVAVVVSPTYRRRTFVLWVGNCSTVYMLYYVGSWLPTLARRSGFSLSDLAMFSAAWSVGGVVGAIAVGWQLDRWNPRKVLLVTLVVTLLTCALAFVTPLGQTFVLLLFVLGYCVLGLYTGLSAVAAAAYETAARVTGTSWMLGVGRIGGFVGITVGASLIQAGLKMGTVLFAMDGAVILGILAIACLPDLDAWQTLKTKRTSRISADSHPASGAPLL